MPAENQTRTSSKSCSQQVAELGFEPRSALPGRLPPSWLSPTISGVRALLELPLQLGSWTICYGHVGWRAPHSARRGAGCLGCGCVGDGEQGQSVGVGVRRGMESGVAQTAQSLTTQAHRHSLQICNNTSVIFPSGFFTPILTRGL